MSGWTPVATSGRWSTVVAVLWLLGGLTWLAWPLWDSVGVPGREQVRVEAPWILGAQVAGLGLLGVTMWRESGRRWEEVRAIAVLVGADCLLRTLLSPGAAGVEVVHALPLLAGAGLGLAGGVLTGATAALVTTVLVATTAETLPAQCAVWAVVGALGSLLRWLPVVAAWLLAVPLAVGAGVLSGVLLNLIGWAQDLGTTTEHFVPGLPPAEVAARLWAYTLETSLAHDTVRGLTTALLVVAVGLPVLRALRPPDHRPPTNTVSRADRDRLAALRRREHSARLDHLWATRPADQETT